MLDSSKKPAKIFVEIFLVLASLVIITPFYFAVTNSLKTNGEAILFSFKLPSKFVFDNYLTVFREGNILNGLWNSISITVPNVVLQVLITSFTAFILQRRASRASTVIYNYIVFGLIPSGFLIPTVYLLKWSHLLGTKPGLIMLYIGGGLPFMTLLFTGYMKNIPKEIDESAMVEGCKLIRLFYNIIFPQLKPIIVTAGIFIFMSSWNDFSGPLFYLNRASKYTVTLSVFNFISQFNTRWELVYADLVIIALPITIVYLFAQRYIIDGMTAGAIKG